MKDKDNNLKIKDIKPIDLDKCDRMQKIIRYYKMSQAELAERLDVNQSNLSAILRGKRPCRRIMDDKFLLSFPEISKEWFLHGEGNMLKDGYTTFEPVGMVGASTPTSQGASNLENEMKILQAEIELKDKLIASLQEEVNVLRDMNRQMLQAITKSMESQAQQKNT